MVNPRVTGIAKFFPPEAYAIAVPVTFAAGLAAASIFRWIGFDPEARNIDYSSDLEHKGAIYKDFVRKYFRSNA